MTLPTHDPTERTRIGMLMPARAPWLGWLVFVLSLAVSPLWTTNAPAAGGRGVVGEIREMAKPGKAHERLDALVGEWKVRAEYRVSLDANPELGRGSASYRWDIGKRFVVQTLDLRMGLGKLDGMGIWGYDNYQNHYVASWVDNLDSGISRLEGDWNSERDMLELELTYNDIRTRNRTAAVSELHIPSDDRHTWTIFETHPETGEQVVVFRLEFIREEG